MAIQLRKFKNRIDDARADRRSLLPRFADFEIQGRMLNCRKFGSVSVERMPRDRKLLKHLALLVDGTIRGDRLLSN